jgi:dolichol kinase
VALLAVAQTLRSLAAWPQDITRKVVHTAAGCWVWATVALFDSWVWGVVPFFTFVAINYFLVRVPLLSAIDSPDKSPGTVYFAGIIGAMFATLWRPHEPAADRAFIALAATMALAWGDALAAVVGVRWGRHKYRMNLGWRAGVRSLEGSAVMFVASVIAVGITLAAYAPLPGAPSPTFVTAAIVLCAAAATLAEAASPWGSDNVFVPVAAAAVLWTMLG